MTAFEDSGDDMDELRPLGSEEEFAQLVDVLVTDNAPRLFALVEECGERADGWIVAWGMQFEDHVEVISIDHGPRLSLTSAERAHEIFSHLGAIRLVWCQHGALSGASTAA